MSSETEISRQMFINNMQRLYPQYLFGHNVNNMQHLYDQIYLADCQWPEQALAHDLQRNNSFHGNGSMSSENHSSNGNGHSSNENGHSSNENGHLYLLQSPPNNSVSKDIEIYDNLDKYGSHKASAVAGRVVGQTKTQANIDVKTHGHGENVSQGGEIYHSESRHNDEIPTDHQHLETIAHVMHKASIIILGILFVESIIKVLCMGRALMNKKLEVFDAVVVFVSFVVDIIFVKGMGKYKVQVAVFILSFLLPWRVIRVVNSLIVAVLDHEHFRLKMLYKEKKAIAEELSIYKEIAKRWEFHLKKIETFCESEGIPKWKIRQHTAMARKQSTITSMASLALNGFLQGMLLSPSDQRNLEKAINQSCVNSRPNSIDKSNLNSDHSTGQSTFTENDNELVPSEDPYSTIGHDNYLSTRNGSCDSHAARPLLVRQASIGYPASEVVEDIEFADDVT